MTRLRDSSAPVRLVRGEWPDPAGDAVAALGGNPGQLAQTGVGAGDGAEDPDPLDQSDGGVDEALARDAMRLAIQKLPIKAKFVTREETEAAA